MFGSTYVCEQLFSVMKQHETKYCSRLKDSLQRVSAPGLTLIDTWGLKKGKSGVGFQI